MIQILMIHVCYIQLLSSQFRRPFATLVHNWCIAYFFLHKKLSTEAHAYLRSKHPLFCICTLLLLNFSAVFLYHCSLTNGSVVKKPAWKYSQSFFLGMMLCRRDLYNKAQFSTNVLLYLDHVQVGRTDVQDSTDISTTLPEPTRHGLQQHAITEAVVRSTATRSVSTNNFRQTFLQLRSAICLELSSTIRSEQSHSDSV